MKCKPTMIDRHRLDGRLNGLSEPPPGRRNTSQSSGGAGNGVSVQSKKPMHRNENPTSNARNERAVSPSTPSESQESVQTASSRAIVVTKWASDDTDEADVKVAEAHDRPLPKFETSDKLVEEAHVIPLPKVEASEEMESVNIDDVFVVRTVEEARRAMEVLHEAVKTKPDRVFACDTEVKDIDVLKQSPRGHGSVICFSVYSGPDVIFHTSESGIDQDLLWVDTLAQGDREEEALDVLNIFRTFFEDEKFIKVWHNLGFDRHVMTNMGIACRGFGGDTMHMGRLWDSSRKGKGYSLEALSSAKELNQGTEVKKTSMKELFGRRKLKKDQTEGKAIILDPVEILQQRQPQKWIHYSARDAKATYTLFHNLKHKLENVDHFACSMDADIQSSYPTMATLWDFYRLVWRPFGELLTEMEDAGFYVDVEHLKKAEARAIEDREHAAAIFTDWVNKMTGCRHINPGSDAQIRVLLFGGIKNWKSEDKYVEKFRMIKIDNPEYYLHKEEKRKGRAPKKMMDVRLPSVWGDVDCPLHPEVWTASGWPAVSGDALRKLVGKAGVAPKILQREFGIDDKRPSPDIEAGTRSDDADEKQESSNEELIPTPDEIAYHRNAEAQKLGLGQLYMAFDNHREGLEACRAVEALIEMNAIDTLLTSFIVPLQGDDIKAEDGRIHGSMNINTETGRLSCRRPNLQNQPALEKDRYKVRESFKAEKGRLLIVADYGQLELRILAHLTKCKSMLDAFESGGDFHSRTAMGMYDHIKNDVDAGKVALEAGEGGTELQLVKDVYSSERRKAKVLNFSIAYGKTAHGLSKDWMVSVSEAENTLEKWYADRQEVREWQQKTIEEGRKRGYVTTLLGRRRKLPELRSSTRSLRSSAERAAINTPIQGSAADIATVAMIAIRRNLRLEQLGWKMLSQVHDEIILEGPEESADEALELVERCMEMPFPSPNGNLYHNPLRVKLTVEANQAKTWYGAK